MHSKDCGSSVSGLRLAERHHRPHPHPSHPLLAHGQSPPSPTPRAAGPPFQSRQQGQAEGVSEVPCDPGLQGSFSNVPERDTVTQPSREAHGPQVLHGEEEASTPLPS